MKKLMVAFAASAMAVVLSGCIHPAAINSAIMLDELQSGDFIDNSVKMEKCGRAEAKHVILFATGDASIRAAMRDADIKKIHHVDYKSTNVLGLYMRLETLVYGE